MVSNSQHENNKVIDIKGVPQKRFVGDYSIEGPFYKEIAPILCYGSYAALRGHYETFAAYVDKDGQVYYEKKEIEELDKYYNTIFKPSFFRGKKFTFN